MPKIRLLKSLRKKGAELSITAKIAPKPADVPKISVIIPVYNGANTLERCLVSVLTQSFRDFEVIIINDGSTDNSLELVYQLTKGDRRVSVYTQQNKGVSFTRNFGLQKARGDWLYFVDCDDFIATDALEIMYNAAQQEAVDIVVCDFWRRQQGRIVHKGCNPTMVISQRQFMKTMMKYPANLYYACLWNKFIRRSIVQEFGIGFDTSMMFGEDHIFVLEYLRHVRKLAIVGQALYYYNDTPGSLVHQAMNAVDIVKNKAFVLEKITRLCLDLEMASSPMELVRIAKFTITPSWDYLVLPLPGRSIARHIRSLGESGYDFEQYENE